MEKTGQRGGEGKVKWNQLPLNECIYYVSQYTNKKEKNVSAFSSYRPITFATKVVNEVFTPGVFCLFNFSALCKRQCTAHKVFLLT